MKMFKSKAGKPIMRFTFRISPEIPECGFRNRVESDSHK